MKQKFLEAAQKIDSGAEEFACFALGPSCPDEAHAFITLYELGTGMDASKSPNLYALHDYDYKIPKSLKAAKDHRVWMLLFAAEVFTDKQFYLDMRRRA